MFIRRLFNVTAAALLIWGGFLLTRVAHSIGRVYGGFIVIHDLTQEPPFYVGYFPWRTVRSAPFFLQAEDHLLSIQGLPPEAYPTIYAAAQPGEPIEYVVERRGQDLNHRRAGLYIQRRRVCRRLWNDLSVDAHRPADRLCAVAISVPSLSADPCFALFIAGRSHDAHFVGHGQLRRAFGDKLLLVLAFWCADSWARRRHGFA